MSEPSNADLIASLDGFFRSLCEESRTPTAEPEDGQPAAPKIGFIDRLKLFEAGTRWVAVRNRIEPGGSDDEFGKLRRGYGNSGARKRGANHAPPSGPVRPANGAA